MRFVSVMGMRVWTAHLRSFKSRCVEWGGRVETETRKREKEEREKGGA